MNRDAKEMNRRMEEINSDVSWAIKRVHDTLGPTDGDELIRRLCRIERLSSDFTTRISGPNS